MFPSVANEAGVTTYTHALATPSCMSAIVGFPFRAWAMDIEVEYLHQNSFAIPNFEISESAISAVVQYSNPTESNTSFLSQLIRVRLQRLFSDGSHYESWAMSPSASEPWLAYEFPVRRESQSINSSSLSNVFFF
jgi:hypothetical protein